MTSSKSMKKILVWLPLVLLILFFVGLYFLRDTANDFASEMIRKQIDAETESTGSLYVDSAFNYQKNLQGFEITFLEFGATGCAACKRMEIVMSEIESKYPKRVKVVFLNVLLPEHQILMKYFGVAAIPTQILLDHEGIEFFRHSGYYSTNDLEKSMKLIHSD